MLLKFTNNFSNSLKIILNRDEIIVSQLGERNPLSRDSSPVRNTRHKVAVVIIDFDGAHVCNATRFPPPCLTKNISCLFYTPFIIYPQKMPSHCLIITRQWSVENVGHGQGMHQVKATKCSFIRHRAINYHNLIRYSHHTANA